VTDDWTSGYVADIGYTYGYYADLNPVLARFALLSAGVVAPTIENACELGFGQGVSVNMHAAASTTRWWGTDFNPSQAAFAQELTAAADSKASLYDEAFEEFCSRKDLPEMDFIGLHGIWSWISDSNRKVIVDFIRRKLKVGGVLYISYNTHPGWAAAAPLRDLLTDHADMMGAPGQGIVTRIDAALAFADKLIKTNPRYAAANPQIAERLKKIATQDRHYIAHEYFNRDWEPMSFAKFSNWMGPAKVNFACSAGLLDHVDALNLTPEQSTMLREIPDARFRQTVRDFCVNQQFRKDFWVRGARPMSAAAQREGLDQQQIILNKRAVDVNLTVGGAQGEGKLAEAIYAPILEALGDNKPKSIGQLLRAMKGKNVSPPQLLQAIVVLAGRGDVQPVVSTGPTDAVKRSCANLNRHITDLSRTSAMVNYLASPITGGGVPVHRFDQLFLDAFQEGEKTADGWVRKTWEQLSRQGQRLTKEGKSIDTVEESLAVLKKHATEFAEKRLDVLKGMGVA
jgi:SAM-dependent methyltransferase